MSLHGTLYLIQQNKRIVVVLLREIKEGGAIGKKKKKTEKLLWKRGSVSYHAERQLCEVVLQLKHEGQEGVRLHWEEATASGKFLR